MHYYQFNIGDYQSHTGHLDPIEDIIYRRMLDWCYLHEAAMPNDTTKIARQIRMVGHESAVREILNEFFILAEEGWYQSRIDQEIKHYHSKVQQASRAGKASAERRLNARSTDVQPNINQEPINKKQTKEATPKVAVAPVVLPDWIPLDTWEAYLAMRKKIKKPATDYAIKLLIDKLTKFKANGQDIKAVLEKSITSGWQDVFEIHDRQLANKFDVAHVTTPTPPNQDAALKKIADDRKKAVPMPADIRAKMAELTKGMKV